MFDKLKKAFSSAAKGLGQKEITEKVLDDTLFDLQMSLLESDVAQEAVDALSTRLKKELLGLRLEKGEDADKIIESRLQNSVAEVFANAGRLDITEKIRAKKASKSGPFVIVFLGINGTGKTTTVAKVANLLRKSGFTVVIAAGDTHRAGAIEQLSQHANRLSLKVIAQRYGADPSAVGRDAVEHARKNYIDVVLVDTAGRMQTSKNLMDEMGKIVRVVRPDAKLFIGDALAGNDTINQAREFFEYTNFDGAILTKIDADAKGGAAISIAHITSKPIVYVGIGQGYDDIIPFEPDKFIESLFGSAAEVKVEDLMLMPRPTPHVVAEEAEVERAEVGKPLAEIVQPPAEPPAAAEATVAEKMDEKVEQTAREAVHKPVTSEPEPLQKFQEKPESPPPQPPEPSKRLIPEPATKPKKVSARPPVEQEPVEEPKEKKGRFGGLFKKKSGEERKKEEAEKRRAAEERKREEEEKARAEEEEMKKIEKEKEEKKKRKEDKDTQEDKIVYLTDEDIEDLLK